MASPNPENDKNKKDAAIEQEPSTQERKTGAVKTSGLGDSQRASAKRNSANHENSAKRQTKWERRQFWVQAILTAFTGGAFIAATVYAHYARQQRDAMTKSISETHSLVVTADKQLRYSERPWLGLGIINITQNFAHNQPMKIDLPFQNSGKSPGLHVVVYGVFKPYRTYIEYAPFEVPFQNELPECSRPKPEWNDNLAGC